jgi:hypothetical protein
LQVRDEEGARSEEKGEGVPRDQGSANRDTHSDEHSNPYRDSHGHGDRHAHADANQHSTASPTATATATATPTATVIPQVYYNAAFSNGYKTVTGTFGINGRAVPNVRMDATWTVGAANGIPVGHCSALTDNFGNATCSGGFLIANHQPIFVVVTFNYNGSQYRTQTSFTP